MNLSGKRVVITGASRGIGELIARKAAGAGARVALVARSREKLEKLSADLGGDAYAADLADPAGRDGLIARITEDGPIDVLVNNAGVDHAGRLVDVKAAELNGLLELNLHAPMELCRQVLPSMIERSSGHIVNMSSIAGTIGAPGLTLYTASKAGLSHFTACLRAEVKGRGIGTTLVEFGPASTDMMDSLRSYAPTARSVRRFERLKLLVELDPDDVAAAVVAAIQHDRRHVRMPKRAALFPMMAELPRRMTELILTGVDHHSA